MLTPLSERELAMREAQNAEVKYAHREGFWQGVAMAVAVEAMLLLVLGVLLVHVRW